MNVAQLISNAFYLSGIVARGLQTVSGEQTGDGLFLLNNILAEKSITSNFLLYYTHDTFETAAGQEIYDIDGLVDLTQLTFNINDVQFPLIRETQYTYFGLGKIIDLQSLPSHYYAERKVNGTRLYLYFVPDAVYTVNITGKYALSQVELLDDLTDTLDLFYLSYLQYLLAKRLCEFYGVTMNESALGTLAALDDQIDRMVGVDLSIRRRSMFNQSNQLNLTGANLYAGWDVP